MKIYSKETGVEGAGGGEGAWKEECLVLELFEAMGICGQILIKRF